MSRVRSDLCHGLRPSRRPHRLTGAGIFAAISPTSRRRHRRAQTGGRAVRRRMRARTARPRNPPSRACAPTRRSREPARTAMEGNRDRLARLEAHRQRMIDAGPFGRVALMVRDGDVDIMSAAYADFEPAVPVTQEGLLSTAFGFVVLWGAFLLIAGFVRSLVRRRAPRPVEPDQRARGLSGKRHVESQPVLSRQGLQSIDPAALACLEQRLSDGLEQRLAPSGRRRRKADRDALGVCEAAPLQHVLDGGGSGLCATRHASPARHPRP